MARKTDDPATWKPVYILNPDIAMLVVPQSAWQAVIESLRADGHIKAETRTARAGFGAPVAEGFDIYGFCEAYSIEILAEYGDRFDVACPLKAHDTAEAHRSLRCSTTATGLGSGVHPDHEDITIGKLVSALQAEQGTYQLPLFAERESGIEVEDVGDDFMKEEKPWNE